MFGKKKNISIEKILNILVNFFLLILTILIIILFGNINSLLLSFLVNPFTYSIIIICIGILIYITKDSGLRFLFGYFALMNSITLIIIGSTALDRINAVEISKITNTQLENIHIGKLKKVMDNPDGLIIYRNIGSISIYNKDSNITKLYKKLIAEEVEKVELESIYREEITRKILEKSID